MAKVSGKTAAIYVGGPATGSSGTGDLVPGLVSFTIPETARVDATTAGLDMEAFILGLTPGTVSAECLYDASESTLETAITSGSTTSAYFYIDSTLVLTMSSCYVTASINSSGPTGTVRRTLTFINAA